MARRSDSPYHDGGDCPYPPGFEDSALYDGDVNLLAQNEGQKILTTALHLPAGRQVDE